MIPDDKKGFTQIEKSESEESVTLPQVVQREQNAEKR